MKKKIFNITYDDKGRRKWSKPAEVPVMSTDSPPTQQETDQSTPSLGRAPLEQTTGFHCKRCAFTTQDSSTWLDH